MKRHKFTRFILNWVWQLPQTLLGKILRKITKAERKETAGIEWWLFDRNLNRFTRLISGVSLSDTILLPYESEETVKHEYGHSIQSLYLGFLYLLVVGIYSAIFCNLWDRLFHKSWCSYDRVYWYYKTRWTERWADMFGGVDRDNWLFNAPRPTSAKYPYPQISRGRHE